MPHFSSIPNNDDFESLKEHQFGDFKVCKFTALSNVVQLAITGGLAYLFNVVGHITYPNALFTCVPYLFVAGMAFGVIAIVLFTLKPSCVWSESVALFRKRYSIGQMIQDISIICLHASVSISFYARCQAGPCSDESIAFCNPDDKTDEYPSGHAHFLLMLPIITQLLVLPSSLGAILISWAMTFSALVLCKIHFGLGHGTHVFIGHSGLVLFTILGLEKLLFEQFLTYEKHGINPIKVASIDNEEEITVEPAIIRTSPSSPAKSDNVLVRRTPSFRTDNHIRYLGVPYVFVKDLLAPAQVLKDSIKSLIKLVETLNGFLHSEDVQKDMLLVIKKMESILKQASVCSNLLSMQVNLAGDGIKCDVQVELRPKSQHMNFSSILLECISIAKNMQKAVTIKVVKVPKEAAISSLECDSDWVQENLLCIICNAIRLSSAKGTVHVSVEVVEDESTSTPSSVKAKEKIMPIKKFLKITVDCDGVNASKAGLKHPAELMRSWVEYLRVSDSQSQILVGSPKAEVVTTTASTKVSNMFSKVAVNGAVGLCVRSIMLRSEALGGSFDLVLGPMPSRGDTAPQDDSGVDITNNISIAGGCHFVFTIPHVVVERKVVSPTENSGKVPWSQNENASESKPNNLSVPLGSTNKQSPDKKVTASGTTKSQENQQKVNAIPEDSSRAGDFRNLKSHNTKFIVAPSKLVMQVTKKINRHGDYGISDSDDDVELEIAADRPPIGKPSHHHGHAKHGGNRVHAQGSHLSFHQNPGMDRHFESWSYPEEYSHDAHETYHLNLHQRGEAQQRLGFVAMQRNGYQEAPIRNAHSFQSNQSQQHQHQQYRRKSTYREEIKDLNSPNWRPLAAESDDRGYSQQQQNKFRHDNNYGDSRGPDHDEALEALARAKDKISFKQAAGSIASGQLTGGSLSKSVGGSQFAIAYSIKPQSILLIIPGNISDVNGNASSIISGLKEAGKEVQLESNFVYALNILLSGASFDAIIMDISTCNSFEATEFVRRIRTWERSISKQGQKELHQFICAFTLDDVVISADNELHAGVDTILPPPIKVTAILDVLNIIKILSV